MNKKTSSCKKKVVLNKSESKSNLPDHDEDKSEERKVAEILLSPLALNSANCMNFTRSSFLKTTASFDMLEVMGVMREKIVKVKNGDLSDMEATLTAQSVSLDAMFSELARRASLNMGENLDVTEKYMRLALKAQSQCARTIEVLAAMKNPPVVFAKQANISQGNQQVNNGSFPTNTRAHAHTGEINNQPNELLEVNHGSEKMDSRTAQTAIPKDKAVATVAT